MSKRAAFWLAWFTWLLYLVFAFIDLLFQIKNTPSDLLLSLLNALVLLAFATVGALIASRRPQNPIGWIFCVSSLLWAIGDVMQEYADYTLFTAPDSLPAGALFSVIGGIITGTGWFLMLTFLLLLFPNGRLLSPRWRPLALLIVVLLTANILVQLFSPINNMSGPDPRLATIPNPIGISAAKNLFDQLTGLIPLSLFATILACIVGVFLRFRRARGVERQQLKWFAYGTILTILMLIIIIIIIFSNAIPSFSGEFFILAVFFIPISAGIAMLRYRLYDIDVLINRTLIYGVLTAVLALAYAITVLVLQYFLSGFAGGSQFSIVGSTLVIAVLFQPLRHRIQRIIDHRFYRSKYNAAHALQMFSSTLRNEVDLETLSEHLIAVVQESMQPAHISLWLHTPEKDNKQRAPWRALPPVSPRVDEEIPGF